MNDLIELKDVTPDRWIHGETRAYTPAKAVASGFRWRRPAIVASALALTALAGWSVNAQIAASRRAEAQLQAQAQALNARKVMASTAVHEDEIKSLRDEVRNLRADLHAAELKHKAAEARALQATAAARDKKIAAKRADVAAASARVADKTRSDKTKPHADMAAQPGIDRTPVGSIFPDKSLAKPPRTVAKAPAHPHVARQQVDDDGLDYANGFAPRPVVREAPAEAGRMLTSSRRDEFVVVDPRRGRFVAEPDMNRSLDRRESHFVDR